MTRDPLDTRKSRIEDAMIADAEERAMSQNFGSGSVKSNPDVNASEANVVLHGATSTTHKPT
jgi:hypothetical protein